MVHCKPYLNSNWNDKPVGSWPKDPNLFSYSPSEEMSLSLCLLYQARGSLLFFLQFCYLLWHYFSHTCSTNEMVSLQALRLGLNVVLQGGPRNDRVGPGRGYFWAPEPDCKSYGNGKSDGRSDGNGKSDGKSGHNKTSRTKWELQQSSTEHGNAFCMHSDIWEQNGGAEKVLNPWIRGIKGI